MDMRKLQPPSGFASWYWKEELAKSMDVADDSSCASSTSSKTEFITLLFVFVMVVAAAAAAAAAAAVEGLLGITARAGGPTTGR